MIDFMETLPALVTTLALILAARMYFSRRAQRAASRRSDLTIVASVLEQHRKALAAFVESDAAPENLKEALLRFSKALSSEDIARQIVDDICAGARSPRSNESDQLKKRIDALRDNHPELVTAFTTAVGTAFVAMMLRWEGPSEKIKSQIARLAAEPERELVTFSRAVKMQKQKAHNDVDDLPGTLRVA